ncbi:amino acid/amide ABC transporter ATP-binding protein 2 (HAAT family) [Stella humosa]|uniref:Amino acid/amide ABC transporter ATP-binding protein 2 (HAAT family) n=1 Tax=Stella humosa TaxID=94 RepID=A0A3N1M3M4_9PROT|nr:ABC transporter ATP-binding protein [Stella humosa]ROQ00342.1 amino acid/amide ABC transporter ATP-binding protein 2 (HAAT family) [Stella humosa]BBK30418.1 ABC transporter ATP-binding protein [Stella humosa]
MLTVEGLNAHYGKSHILQGVSLTVGAGELVTLLGRNGAGKTTTLRAIMRLLPPTGGRVAFMGQDLAGMPTHAIARLGLAMVPEHRGIFSLLSVRENLEIAVDAKSPWQIEDVFGLFPRLAERRRNLGSRLSGGEQQMLAIARALVSGPRLLLLDEPTEGLAPVIVNELVETFRRIRDQGTAILLVEQNLAVCMKLGDRHTIIDLGRTVYEGSAADFAADEAVKDRYLTLRSVVT